VKKQYTFIHMNHFASFHWTFIIKKNPTCNLHYGDLKFEKWAFKLLISMNKGLNKKRTHNLLVIKILFASSFHHNQCHGLEFSTLCWTNTFHGAHLGINLLEINRWGSRVSIIPCNTKLGRHTLWTLPDQGN
jgi:hypothetical protein